MNLASHYNVKWNKSGKHVSEELKDTELKKKKVDITNIQINVNYYLTLNYVVSHYEAISNWILTGHVWNIHV